jgi:hypothetical protein
MLSQAARERRLAAAERSQLKRNDLLLPHGLAATELLAWRAALSSHKGLKRAWLARKHVRYLQAVPAYLLVIEFSAIKWVSGATLQRVADCLPEGVNCLVLNKAASRSAGRQIKGVEGSLIFAPDTER